MRITVDTNVLVRCVVRDDEQQALAADKVLNEATLIAVPLPCLCEFVWVLRKVYAIAPSDIAAAVRVLLSIPNIVLNRQAVEAGLSILEAGGDFADGAMAMEGGLLGGEVFASFDKKAVNLVKKQGLSALLLE